MKKKKYLLSDIFAWGRTSCGRVPGHAGGSIPVCSCTVWNNGGNILHGTWTFTTFAISAWPNTNSGVESLHSLSIDLSNFFIRTIGEHDVVPQSLIAPAQLLQEGAQVMALCFCYGHDSLSFLLLGIEVSFRSLLACIEGCVCACLLCIDTLLLLIHTTSAALCFMYRSQFASCTSIYMYEILNLQVLNSNEVFFFFFEIFDKSNSNPLYNNQKKMNSKE